MIFALASKLAIGVLWMAQEVGDPTTRPKPPLKDPRVEFPVLDLSKLRIQPDLSGKGKGTRIPSVNLLDQMAAARQKAAASANKSGKAKWKDKDANALRAGLPPELVRLLQSGPLDRETAHRITQALIRGELPPELLGPDPAAELGIDPLGPGESEPLPPFLAQLDQVLAAAVGTMPAGETLILDVRWMKSQFSPVDQDSSGDWSIVEFRDHTGLGLLEFREVDQDRDGVLQFLEWSLALLTVAPSHEVMLHSGLAQWIETAQAQVLAAALKESLAPADTKPVKRPALSEELAALEKMWATGEVALLPGAERSASGPGGKSGGAAKPTIEPRPLNPDLEVGEAATQLADQLFPREPPPGYRPGWGQEAQAPPVDEDSGA